ncbi:hypothetical protein R3P38DRAFT_2581340 [Favolaschia claudopus]|uniref:Uncharacterized protein n=1 Tax=Favolaschia claudopus TaxID=2862362 RepID=A0AAV9ZBM0_9AGAR
MVITNLAETLPHLRTTALPVFSALYPEEIYPVNSAEPGYSYCAVHKSVYNRYSEQGTGAPDVHPNLVAREGVTKVNHSQRAPRESKETKDEPEESNLTAEFIQLITTVIELHIKKLLPEEYSAIEVWASHLPLNERSAAYPFGGYVINLCISTVGHRDKRDHRFCVVISYCHGEGVGGDLGMYETGLLLRTRPWDVSIFPSCEITHFNTPINGVRISIVLHSDIYGERWVANKNGWENNESVLSLAFFPCTKLIEIEIRCCRQWLLRLQML